MVASTSIFHVFLNRLRLAGLGRDVRRALRLVWQAHPGLTGWSILLDTVVAILPLAAFYGTKLVIDQLVDRLNGGCPLRPPSGCWLGPSA